MTPHPVVLERDVPRPIEFEDSTLVCGGFLKTPVRVEVERQGLNRFVLISKCDWVFHAVVGRSRSRTALSAVRTFEKLRVVALAVLEMERRRNEELEVADPMLALSRTPSSSACARSRSARPRRCCAALAPAVVEVLAADVAPYTLPEAGSLTTISVYVVPRARTTPLVYVLDSNVDMVISVLRHELCL